MRNELLFFILIISQAFSVDIFQTGTISFNGPLDVRQACDDALVVEITENSPPVTFCRDLQIPNEFSSSRINNEEHLSNEFNFFHGRSTSTSTVNCISNESSGEITACSIIDETEGMVYQISRDDTGVLKTTASHSSEFPSEVSLQDKSRRRLGERGNIFHSRKYDEKKNAIEDGSELGVLVTWTKTAECKQSGLDSSCTLTEATKENMVAMITLAVAETNVAFDMSGVKTALKLVHAYRDDTDGPDSSIQDTLYELGNPTDGRYDDVHDKRAQYGADLVAMIHSDSNQCGTGFRGPSKDYMFSVTSYLCATGNFSFGHEISHNLGCGHDRATSNKCTDNENYNYGFRDPDANFRSMMAYDCDTAGCDNNSASGHCVRVQRLSNNNIQYKGASIGNALNDNARQINDVRVEVSNYFYENCSSARSASASPSSSIWGILSQPIAFLCDHT